MRRSRRPTRCIRSSRARSGSATFTASTSRAGAADPATAEIRKFFFQRLESPGGAALRAKETREQFAGLSLADFYKHDYFAAADPGNASDKVARLKPPAAFPEAARPDWDATLRGLRKNLILLDLFAFDRRFEPFYQRAVEALKKKETQP